MDTEQKEALQAWCMQTIVDHRIDYIRGSILVCIVDYICVGGSHRIRQAKNLCNGAIKFKISATMDESTSLSMALSSIARRVPLTESENDAMLCILGCMWYAAIRKIDNLHRERATMANNSRLT